MSILIAAQIAMGCADTVNSSADGGTAPDITMSGKRDASNAMKPEVSMTVRPDSGTPPRLDSGTPQPPRRDCHYDCFGVTTCVDGKVIEQLHAPVSCEAWTGTCPRHEVATCKQGCSAERLESRGGCPTDLCKENALRKPGDACAIDEDCLPTRAENVDLVSAVKQIYLKCEADAGVCVEASPPVVTDWMHPCDSAVVNRVTKGAFGATNDESCSEGICVVYAPHDQQCVMQGCSRRCARDSDCPQGAVCQDSGTYCLRGGKIPKSDFGGYCKPGRLNDIGVDLPCL